MPPNGGIFVLCLCSFPVGQPSLTVRPSGRENKPQAFSKLVPLLSPLESAVPQHAPVTPLECAVTEKRGGGVYCKTLSISATGIAPSRKTFHSSPNNSMIVD